MNEKLLLELAFVRASTLEYFLRYLREGKNLISNINGLSGTTYLGIAHIRNKMIKRI
jgi:hypothetical protein